MTRQDPSSQHNLGALLAGATPGFMASELSPFAVNPISRAPKEMLLGPNVTSSPRTFEEYFQRAHKSPATNRSPLTEQLLRESGLDVGFLKLNPRLGKIPGAYMPQAGIGPLAKLQRWAMGIPKAEWKRHGMIASSEPGAAMPAEALAHELGHGQSWHGGGLSSLIAKLRGYGAPIAGGAAMIEGLRGVLGNKSMEERDRLLNTSSAISGAAAVPTLIDEATASRNAMKLLGRLPRNLAGEVLSRAPLTLGGAGATYGLAALGGILGPQAAKWWYHHRT